MGIGCFVSWLETALKYIFGQIVDGYSRLFQGGSQLKDVLLLMAEAFL